MSRRKKEFNPNDLYKSNHRVDRRNPFPGEYRARVEYRQDPLKLGRVKVRIPQRHGIPGEDEDAYSVEELPWARKSNMSMGGFDAGSYIIPPVGSIVYVSYEAGSPDRLVYRGGVNSRSLGEGVRYGVVGDIPDESEVAGGEWVSPDSDIDIPKDVYDDKDDLEPTVDVIHKSEKGHTVKMENEDEKESLSLIDRAGQMFGLFSPVKRDENRTGDESFKRKVRDVLKEDQFDYEDGGDIVDNKAVVFIKDLATQVFRMVSEWTKEKIELISRSKEDDRRSVIKLAGGEEDTSVLIISEDDEQNNKSYVKFNPNENNKVEMGVVVDGKIVSKKEMTEDGYSVTVYEDGDGEGVEWEDTEDELEMMN